MAAVKKTIFMIEEWDGVICEVWWTDSWTVQEVVVNIRQEVLYVSTKGILVCYTFVIVRFNQFWSSWGSQNSRVWHFLDM
jgi:hypothetical protein